MRRTFLTLGEVILIRRKRLGITQKRLAKMLEISVVTMRQIERMSLCSFELQKRLASILRLPMTVFTVGGDDCLFELDAPEETVKQLAVFQLQALWMRLENEPLDFTGIPPMGTKDHPPECEGFCVEVETEDENGNPTVGIMRGEDLLETEDEDE